MISFLFFVIKKAQSCSASQILVYNSNNVNHFQPRTPVIYVNVFLMQIEQNQLHFDQ